MGRFYLDLTLWFNADVNDDDELKRVYTDIATRIKGRYGVQAFSIRQAPIPQQQVQEYQEEEIPVEQEQEQIQEPVTPTTPPPKQQQQQIQQEDEYEEVEEEE
jgi:hypothetical protein